MHAVARCDGRGVTQGPFARGVPADGVAAAEHGQRAQRLEPAGAFAQLRFRTVPPPGHRGREASVGADQPGPDRSQAAAEIAGVEPPLQLLYLPFPDEHRGASCARECMPEFGDVPSAIGDASGKPANAGPGGEQMHAAAERPHPAQRGRAQPVAQAIDPRVELGLRGDDHFGGRRRRRRTQVGHEVGDRHVGLVSDRRDHRHLTERNRPRDDLLVERPEVLDRPAAAARR